MGLPVARLAQTDLSPVLHGHMLAIRERAIEYGLTFHEVIFQSVPFDVMNQIAAYGGFPTRYPHWRWGMEYEKLAKRDAYGLGRIYEMVINTDPVYAYLQESNSVTDQKLVMAHVYGHADFFRNNAWFARTNRRMLDEMANHATRVRRHIDDHGHDTVERFIDACLSVEWLIDPFDAAAPTLATPAGAPRDAHGAGPGAGRGFVPDKLPAKDYLDRYINPPEEIERQRRAHEQASAERGRVPARPTRDVLAFLLRHAPLAPWQQDILAIVRDEAAYFVPQAMTKVMNEGWASYWHSLLMTRHFVQASEIVCYCDQHAGVLHMPAGAFNPYKIGIELWRDIERRWDTGQHGSAWESLDRLGARERHDDRAGAGREQMFQVRRVYNDVSFIDEFFTEEFCASRGFFTTRTDEASGQTRIASRDFAKVKSTLLHHLTNRGEPFIYVVDANHRNRGELLLAHPGGTGASAAKGAHELDGQRAERVLRNLRLIWGRPVHLHSVYREELSLLSCESEDGPLTRERISGDLAPPLS